MPHRELPKEPDVTTRMAASSQECTQADERVREQTRPGAGRRQHTQSDDVSPLVSSILKDSTQLQPLQNIFCHRRHHIYYTHLIPCQRMHQSQKAKEGRLPTSLHLLHNLIQIQSHSKKGRSPRAAVRMSDEHEKTIVTFIHQYE